jgi:hypothetical protein
MHRFDGATIKARQLQEVGVGNDAGQRPASRDCHLDLSLQQRLADLMTGRRSVVAQPPSRLRAPRFDRPAIAVLPFVNASDEPEQDYFSSGISEDIITALASCAALRHRAQLLLRVSGQVRADAADRGGARRRLSARG